MNKIDYNLKTHRAEAVCKSCNEVIVSAGGGRFTSCTCGKSFIDQERFDARWVRLGGDADFIEQICPPHCNLKEHK